VNPRRCAAVLAWILAAGTFRVATAAPEAPPPPDEARVAGFLQRHGGDGVVVIQSWQVLDAELDGKDGGLGGSLVGVTDYCVRDRDDLESAASIVTYEDPHVELKDVEVEVIRGGKVTRHRRKDLKWRKLTRRSDGVVTLDGTIAMAMVPGLRVGDRVRIVEEYRLKGTFGLPAMSLGDRTTPYLETGLEIRLPDDYRLVWDGTGVAGGEERLTYAETRRGGRTVHRWELGADADGSLPKCRDDHPAFRVVPHIAETGRGNRKPLVAAGSTWSEVGLAYLDLIEGVFEPDDRLRSLTASLVAGVSDPLERIDRIYADVQERCRYLGLYEGTGGMVPVPAAEVLEAGFGDCKGLGTLLIAMLRQAGFDAHPVLVRLGEPGSLDPDIPNMVQFNHYIAWVDTGDGGLFLDGTVEHCPAGLVPVEDAGSPVLLLLPDGVQMVEIPAAAWDPGESLLTIAGRIEPDGRLHLQYSNRVTGNLGRRWRSYLDGRERGRAEAVRGILMPRGLAFRGGDPELSGMGDRRDFLEIRLAADLEGPLPGDARTLFLPRQLAGSPPEFDPDLVCGRSVDLRRRADRRESWSIAMPEGLALAHPDSLALDEGGVRWTSRVWQEGTTLRLERSVAFGERSLSPEEAETLAERLHTVLRSDTGYLELLRP